MVLPKVTWKVSMFYSCNAAEIRAQLTIFGKMLWDKKAERAIIMFLGHGCQFKDERDNWVNAFSGHYKNCVSVQEIFHLLFGDSDAPCPIWIHMDCCRYRITFNPVDPDGPLGPTGPLPIMPFEKPQTSQDVCVSFAFKPGAISNNYFWSVAFKKILAEIPDEVEDGNDRELYVADPRITSWFE
jgi:hypothetical protein